MIDRQYRGAMPQRKKRERRPAPEPYEVDERPFVVAGMVTWVVAFVVLAVFFRSDLRRHHAEFWLWSCGIGVLLGLYGLHFAKKRRR